MQQTEEIRACRACMATDCELHDLMVHGLFEIFQQITALGTWTSDSKPKHICSFCRAQLRKAYRFRLMCTETDQILLRNDGDLTHLRHTNKIMPILSHTEMLVDACGGENEENGDNDTNACDRTSLTLDPDVMIVDPLTGTETEVNCNNRNKSLEIPPKQENEGNMSETDNMYEYEYQFDDDTQMKVEYLEEIHEDVSEPKKKSKTSRSSKSKDTTIPKSSTSKVSSSLFKQIPLTTLQDVITKLEGKKKTCAIVNRIAFYNHIVDKYHKKVKINEGAHLWDADDTIPDNLEEQESERLHEIADDSTALTTVQKLELFYSFLKRKYREAEGTTDQSETRNNSKSKPIKLNLYADKDINSKVAQEFEQKYQIKVTLFASKEEKLRFFESLKHKAYYLKMAYKCDICYVGYQRKDLYARHMMLHDPSNGTHECEVCHRFYESRSVLSHHVLSHKHQFTCLVPKCGATFPASVEAKHHSDTHKGTVYPCRHCNKIFQKHKTRTEHHRIHHGDVACPLCHRVVSGTKALVLHRTKMHPVVYPCLGCGAQFASLSALNRHSSLCAVGGVGGDKAAGGVEGATGREVGASGSVKVAPGNVKGASEDMEGGSGAARGVEGAEGWACGACGETADTKENLEQHIDTTHKVGKKGTKVLHPEKAWRAGKPKRRPPCLHDTAEAEGHPRRPRFEPVEICSANCKYKYRHFMCEICSKLFSAPVFLREHLLVHTGEKPHGCRDCSKRFRTKFQLQNHMSVHSDVRPYTCDQCGKAFKSVTNFKRHERNVHIGLRPFGCDICGKAYQSKHDVRTHIKTAHMNLPWPKRDRVPRRKTKD